MSDLNDFTKDLIGLAIKLDKGKEAKKFIGREATKLRKKTLNVAKGKVNKKTGNLFKGIKKGKTKKSGDAVYGNVYGDGNIAHHLYLVNNGHIITGKDGSEHGFKEGEHFLEEAEEDFTEEFYDDIEDFVDMMLDEHGL